MKKIKIEELEKDLFLGDFGDRFCEYRNGYICDIISEIADDNIDTYPYDLLSWVADTCNYIYVEEANAEYGVPADGTNLIEQIKQGQFYAYEKDLYNNLEDGLIYWAYNYIKETYELEEITEKQNDELLSFNFGSAEKFEEIIDHIQEIFEEEEN